MKLIKVRFIKNHCSRWTSSEPALVGDELEVSEKYAAKLVEHELAELALKANSAAKKLADETGLDLTFVKGTGKDGVVVKKDVETHRVRLAELLGTLHKALAIRRLLPEDFNGPEDYLLPFSEVAPAVSLPEPGSFSDPNYIGALITSADSLPMPEPNRINPEGGDSDGRK